MKSPRFVQIHHDNPDRVRAEVLAGLQAEVAHASPKHLYDALGSRLFDAITHLPEYYPTRVEAGIFATHGAAMGAALPQGGALIDLGAGNCAKAARLFGVLAPSRYVAVDISVDFMRQALESLQFEHPGLDMVGVGLDFSAGLVLPPEAMAASTTDGDAVARVLFYPGSSIGNFSPAEALVFLQSVRAACGPVAGSGLLIGVDLVKGAAELQAAYDDALGVTAAFNRNLLLNLNRSVGTDFALRDWAHVGLYNGAEARIEMHLQATRATTVCWPGGQRHFAQGERLHTENSYKWTLDGFAQLLTAAGFARTTAWTDPGQRFAVFWAA